MYRHIFIFMKKITADQAALLIQQSLDVVNLKVESYVADFELTFETAELIGVDMQMELRRQIPHASASFNYPRHQPTPRPASFVEVDW